MMVNNNRISYSLAHKQLKTGDKAWTMYIMVGEWHVYCVFLGYDELPRWDRWRRYEREFWERRFKVCS